MIDFNKVREIVNDVVKTAVGEIKEAEPTIESAERATFGSGDNAREVWNVVTSYTPKPSELLVRSRIILNAESGELESFEPR